MEKYRYDEDYSTPPLETGPGPEPGNSYHDVDVFGREENAQVGLSFTRALREAL